MRISKIQIRVVNHCNLNCKYCGSICNNKEEKSTVDVIQYERDLEKLKCYIESIDRIKLLGGEPLLHPEIRQIMRITRLKYPEAAIWIATNGLLLLQQENDFFETIKETNSIVVISVYRSFLSIKDKVEQILKDKGVQYSLLPVYRFFINKRNAYGADINRAWDMCGCRNSLDLSDGILRRCSVMWGMEKLNKQFGTEYEFIKDKDYINIYDDDVDIDSFLDGAKKPGHLCGYCEDTTLKWVDWEPADGNIDLSNYLNIKK